MAFNFGFKKKRDQRPMTISQEKRKADENRQRGEQIRASLEILDAKLIRKAAQNTEGGISGEKLEQYHKALQEMEKKLDEQKASVLDTVVIDSIIGEFIDQMADALVKDNKETADRLMAGLSYGISKGREEINMADPEATKKAMDARREILYRYQQIIRFSAHIDDLDRSIQRQKADIDQTVEAYKVRHEKLKEKYFKDAIAEYKKRLSRFAKVSIVQVPDEKAPEKFSVAEDERVKQIEGERILSKIKDKEYVYVTAIKGKQRSSEEFAKEIQDLATYGHSDITFVIGGSLGTSDAVNKRGDDLISFGKLTMPHQLMRVVLIEQIYRAFMINSGSPYHK